MHILIRFAPLAFAAFTSPCADAAEPLFQGKPVTHWVQTYCSARTASDLERAGGALKSIGPDAVPYLVAWIETGVTLEGGGGDVRRNELVEFRPQLPDGIQPHEMQWRGLEALRLFGPSATAALPVISQLLNSRNVGVRMAACECLQSLRGEALPALPELAAKTADAHPMVRATAVSVIGQIILDCPNKQEQMPMVEHLIRALKDDHQSVRWNAGTALGNFGSDGKRAVPALIESLNSGNPTAASALGRIGIAAKPAVPDLIKALSSSDRAMQGRAEEALKRIAPQVLKDLQSKPANAAP